MSATVSAQQYEAVVAENVDLRAQLTATQQQLEWFKRQLFGAKSEKRIDIDPAIQASLFTGLIEDAPAPPTTETVEITRRKKTRHGAVNESGLRFDETVPVRVIDVAPPAGLEDGEVIATHSTFRLAQRRASYEVLEYRTPVIKTPESDTPQTTPVPGAIFTGSIADVSFLAGMAVDKFAFHLPLYRQHQRLAAGGIQLARATLTQLVARSAALLSPIHAAQLAHVLDSRVLAMDDKFASEFGQLQLAPKG